MRRATDVVYRFCHAISPKGNAMVVSSNIFLGCLTQCRLMICKTYSTLITLIDKTFLSSEEDEFHFFFSGASKLLISDRLGLRDLTRAPYLWPLWNLFEFFRIQLIGLALSELEMKSGATTKIFGGY